MSTSYDIEVIYLAIHNFYKTPNNITLQRIFPEEIEGNVSNREKKRRCSIIVTIS